MTPQTPFYIASLSKSITAAAQLTMRHLLAQTSGFSELVGYEHNLTDSDKERLAQLADTHPVLDRLWRLRQDLHDWYETDATPDQAQLTLNAWMTHARQLGLKHLDAFCDTLTTWRTEIVNFFHHRITSGFVEGMNSKIRVLKRIAFGIPNFEHFRLRVLAFCG